MERIDGTDLIVRATARPARIPSYMGARIALTTNLARRVRGSSPIRANGQRFPDDVRQVA